MSRSTEFVAIDPLALIFGGEVYARIIVNWKHPHEPSAPLIREAARAMTREERAAALSRARTMMAYAKAAEEAMSTLE